MITQLQPSKPANQLPHQPGRRMHLFPSRPVCILRFYLREPSLEIHTLYSHQPFLIWIPQGSRFFVVQNEGSFVGPARWRQGKRPPINFATVHSRQIHQGSVSCDNGFFPEKGIGCFVILQPIHRVGMRISVLGNADDTQFRRTVVRTGLPVTFIQRFKRIATNAEFESVRVETDGNRLGYVPFFTGSVHNICFTALFLDFGCS